MSSPTTPVIFIHGTRSSGAVWAKQQQVMEALGHSTVAIDLPGHGSRADSVFTLSEAFDILDEEIKRLGGEVILVGMSLGGYVAIAYAADHPDRVQAVLAAGCSTETARAATRAYRWMTMTVTQSWKHVSKRFSRPQRADRLPWTVVTDMLAEVGRVSSLTNFRALKMPVWIVSGQWCPLRLGERNTLRAAPFAQHKIIRRAGHDVHVHASDAFNRVLVRMVHQLSLS